MGRTTAGLMGMVLIAALGLAALRSPSDAWAAVMTIMAFGALVAASLRAAIVRGRGRASWAGFAAAGWLCACAWLLPGDPMTARWIDRLHPWLCARRAEVVTFPRSSFDESFSAWAGAHPGATTMILEPPREGDPDRIRVSYLPATLGPFRRIGHALLALIVAALGGLLARAIAAGLGKLTSPDA